MEDRQTRTLIWMAGILTALVAAVVLIDPGEDEDSEDGDEELPTTDPFPNFTVDTIVSLAITPASSAPLRLTRQEDGAWQLTEPFAAQADDQTVQAALSAMDSLECSEDLGAGDDLAQFGLQPPRLAITATTADGTTFSLRIGKDTPVGWTSYVQCGDDLAARTSKQKLSTLFPEDIHAYRDRTALTLPPGDEITALEIRRDDPAASDTLRLQVAPGGGGRWTLGQPPRPADASRIQDLTQKLSSLSVETFDAPPLTPPITSLTLSTSSGMSAEIRLGNNGSALVPAQDAPITLSLDLASALSLSPLDLLSRDLLSLDLGEATALTIALPGQDPLTAQREANGWSLPAAEKAIAALQVVRVERSLQESPEDAAAFDAAAATTWGAITVKSPDPQRPQEEIILYAAVPERNAHPASNTTSGERFWIPITEVQRIQDALR